MGYWESLDEEAELEEGEAASGHVDDYTNIDPDVSLSYIDEKIQNILGHFQKDFEGGVFAHNLGAKFGGYGSFLPMYERSPPRGESQSTLRSSCNLPAEGGSQNTMAAFDGSVIQTSRPTVANSMDEPHNLKVLSDEDLERINSGQIAEKAPERDVPFIKSENPRDQRKLKVRIKVAHDKGLHRNAAIYSGLGLSSPSSSTGNSPEEGRGAQLNFQESFNESTTNILKILTSHPVSSDSLNSPLRYDLLNLITSRKESVRKSAPSLKERSGFIVGSDDSSESARGVKGVVVGKKSKSAQIKENDLHVKGEKEVHSVDKKSSDGETQNGMTCIPPSHVGTDRSFGCVGKAAEVVRHPEQHMPVKKRGLKDKAKERILAREFVKDETLKTLDVQDITKHQESRRDSVENFGKHGRKGFEKEYLFDQGEDVIVKGNKIPSSSSKHEDKMDNLEARNIKLNRPLKVASHVRGKSVKLTAKSGAPKELSSGGKNKLKRSQINGNSTSVSDETLGSEVDATVKGPKSASRDANKVHRGHKDLLDTKLKHIEDQANPPEKHVVHKPKDSNHENISGKWDDEDKSSRKYDFGKSGSKVGPILLQGDTLADIVPPSNGQMSRTEPGVVITEEWVECVRCQTWRLLPPGILAGQLPDMWTCSMQNWLPGMNRCDLSEDETTQALRALYHPPVPETQHTILADANPPLAQMNVATQHHKNLGKKFQSKDISHASNSGGPLVNSHLTKNHQQDVMKSMTQPSSESNLVRKSNVKLIKKPIKALENCSDNLEENGHEKPRKKIKRESSPDNYDQGVSIKVKTEGQEKLKKKLKRERNSDFDDQEVAKRLKTEGPMDIDNLYSSENNEKPGKAQVSSSASFLKKAAPKEKQLDKKEKGKLQISVKIRRDSFPNSVDSGLLDVKTHEATRVSTKMRKLEKSGDPLPDTKISAKENSGDSGFRNGKKFKSSKAEMRGFHKGGAGDKFKMGNTHTTIPGSRTNFADKNAKKAQQFKEKLTSGLTMEDITALRRELGSEQFSTAATSSSSKISGSGRSRANYQEVKGSPAESVSSSPMRPSNFRKLSPTRMCGLVKADSKFGDFPAELSRKRLSYIDDAFESNQSGTSMRKIVGNPSFEIPVPEIQGTDNKGKDTTSLSVRAGHHEVNTAAQTTKRSSPSHVDVQGVTHHTSKIRMSHNSDPSQQQKFGVDPSTRSKESNKASGSNFERVADRVSILSSDQEALQWKQSVGDERQIDQINRASCHKLVDHLDNPFSDESTIKALTHDNNVLKINSGTRMESEKWSDIDSQRQPRFGECDQSEGRMDALGSVHLRTNRLTPLIQNTEVESGSEIIPTDMGVRSRKLKVCLNNDTSGLPFHDGKSAPEFQRGDPLDLRSVNTSKGGKGLHIIESASNSAAENSNHGSMKHPESDQRINGPSHSKEDTTIQNASAALAKAEEYRRFGDFSKESGFECNEAYFKAALMYLLGASLVESSNNESQKGEMNQIQISGSSAKLCESCALEYEKRQEMAAAALAYKCMEVSYMKIVYFKSLCSRRVWHDLQASLQMIPQSESPSSSASDIDNSNYQIINDKVVLCKVNGSSTSNHAIAPRDHQNFIRLLDYTKDVISAMEAARKSQNAFAAASKMMTEQSQDINIITSVKEVIDFGFQDLEVFVRMVQHAIGAISRLGFGGG